MFMEELDGGNLRIGNKFWGGGYFEKNQEPKPTTVEVP